MTSRLLMFFVAGLSCAVARGGENGAKDAYKLAGAWRATASAEAGQNLADNHLRHLRFVISGKEVTAFYGDSAFMKGTFTIDPRKMPMSIDLKSTFGLHAGKSLEGIYELDKDVIKICFAEPGGKRPQDFASTSANKASFFVWERKKTADWLAQWVYDKNDRKNASVPPDTKIFSRRMATTDDVQKVTEFYQAVIDKTGRLVYAYKGKKFDFNVDTGGSGIGGITSPGASGRAEQYINWPGVKFLADANNLKPQDMVKELKIDPDLHSYTVGRDDSLAAGGKENAVRPVTVRVFTQDIKDYTVTIVITRAMNDTHTHIIATFVVR